MFKALLSILGGYGVKLLWRLRGKSYHAEKMSDAYKKMYDYLATICIAEKPENVIEYGCGYGYLLKEIFKKNTGMGSPSVKYFGIDYSNEQIVNAKKYFSDATFKTADITKRVTDFIDNQFDVVIGVGVLMYIKENKISFAMDELYRICKKKIFVIEYYYKYLNDQKKEAYVRAKSEDGRCVYDYEKLLAEAGFRNIKTVHMDLFVNKTINVNDEMAQTLVIAEK